MENLLAAAPATLAVPATNTKATTTDTTGECETPPWVAAFQAALTQHGKNVKLVPLHGAAATDAAESADAASGTDDKQAAADALLAAAPAITPLQLLATLPPIPPAPPAATAPPARADTRQADGANVITANGGGAKAEAGTTLPARTTVSQHGTADVAANSDAMTRLIEHATAHESNGRETNVQPQVPFTLAPAAATPPPAPPAAQLQVNATVGSAAWGAELGQKVVWMTGEKQHVAELHLNPPDLGPLDIKLTVTSSETTAVFTSPHGAVRDAVESAIPRLREVLAESGIMLGNASVTSDTPRDGSAFATPQDQARRGNAHGREQDQAATGAPLSATLPVRHNGLVDLFA